MTNNQKISRFGMIILLSGILLAVGFNAWLALVALLVGSYAGTAISYQEADEANIKASTAVARERAKIRAQVLSLHSFNGHVSRKEVLEVIRNDQEV